MLAVPPEDDELLDDDEAPEDDDAPEEDDELPELDVELLVELDVVEVDDPEPPPHADRSNAIVTATGNGKSRANADIHDRNLVDSAREVCGVDWT